MYWIETLRTCRELAIGWRTVRAGGQLDGRSILLVAALWIDYSPQSISATHEGFNLLGRAWVYALLCARRPMS